MGKLQSKHECFFVNPGLNEALKDDLWKSSSSELNLDTFTMDNALSELSLCLEEKTDPSPLRVELPPSKVTEGGTDTSKLFNLDELSLETKEKKAKSNISLEDFRYGVQLETSENAKQEWFFTLYNFDGHGRITKEDLASLLKALYDSVGSSIQLPPNGAKTLKLRLSVGQDQTAHLKNVTNLKSAADMSRNTITEGKLKSKVKDFSKLNNLMQTQGKLRNDDSPRLTNQGMPALPSCLPSLAQQENKGRHMRHMRRQHKDNRKESNHHQHKRRYRHSSAYCPVLAAASALAAAEAVGTARAENWVKGGDPSGKGDKLEEVTELPSAQESQDRRNYYLDLAGVENTCSRFQNDLTGHGASGPSSHQPRSRSHDVTKWDNLARGDNCLGKCDNVQRENERLKFKHGKGRHHDQQHSRSKSFDCHETPRPSSAWKARHKSAHSPTLVTSNRHSSFQPVEEGVTISVVPPHPRRHRHRAKDHELAMQQVAQWIKREHSCAEGEGEVVVHRHHHIHEHHHHHHYHHYYQT